MKAYWICIAFVHLGTWWCFRIITVYHMDRAYALTEMKCYLCSEGKAGVGVGWSNKAPQCKASPALLV